MERKTIAGYTIDSTLGEGGMGVVYRAVDPTLDRPLAIKVIKRKNLSATAKERFLREARASSASTIQILSPSTPPAKKTAIPISRWNMSRGGRSATS